MWKLTTFFVRKRARLHMELIRKFLDHEITADDFTIEHFEMCFGRRETRPPWWAAEVVDGLAYAGDMYAEDEDILPDEVSEAELRELARKAYDELAEVLE